MKNILPRLLGLVVLGTFLLSMRVFPASANNQGNTKVDFSCALVTEIPQSECEGLVALYNSTAGSNWVYHTNWLVTLTPSNWFGVNVNSGHVEYLTLWSNNLVGSLPPDIGNLTSLKELDLSYSLLSGSIPPELGNLTNLQTLHLDGNQLNGSIPPELGNLTSLIYLNLEKNQLGGSLPPDLGNLTSLQFLALDNNQLSGNIPPELGDLTNLRYIYLYSNLISGSIPPGLGNLTNLIEISLGSNQINGSIPPQLGYLTSLQALSITYNQLSGSIPPELGKLVNLKTLALDGNQLTGNIPSALGNLTNLQSLNLSSNQLSGSIPAQLGNLTSLGGLYLTHNQLSGSLPPELGNLTNLWELNLAYNQISGSIPPGLGNLTDLFSIHLEINQLSGSIPAQLGNLTSLKYLVLSENQLSGTIPDQLGNLASLNELNLSGNQLSGSIPPGLDNLTNLYYINLNYNQLSGSIPSELGNLTNLFYLNLGNNQLSGSIPSELGNLINLTNLDLATNQLSGSIPSRLSYLTSLQYLDLFNNQLSDNIPAGLGNLIHLYSLNLRNNQLSGSIPRELGSVTNLNYLDLGINQFTGYIPPDLSKMTNLYYLSLDNNQFSGSIPGELGNLSNLNYLNLGGNQLNGSVPSTLGSLVNLQTLNLSNNQLKAGVPPELGNLHQLHNLSLENNPLSGSLPLELSQIASLYFFQFYETNLCEPTDPVFLAWLHNIYSYSGTGIACLGEGPDFIITAIEVTQAIQNLKIDDPVLLIENKGAFARVHVLNNGSTYRGRVTANLCNGTDCLIPSNKYPRIVIRKNPDRGDRDQSFYYQLPPDWLQGTINLSATVNPPGWGQVDEANLDNNELAQSFSFVPSVPLKIKLFGIQYSTLLPFQTYKPRQVDYDLIISWLSRAYPVSEIQFSQSADMVDLGFSYDPGISAFDVDLRLYKQWIWDTLWGVTSQDTRYYGLVPDDLGQMTGASLGIPSVVASGPVGIPREGYYPWDTDESYGDWYAGHELAHTYGRYHPGYCGTPRDPRHPDGDYPDGKISPSDASLYGFDILTRKIYTPSDWYDVMTYCENNWISDFTYEGIYNHLTSFRTKSARTASTGEHVIVSGWVNYSQNTATLETSYRIPDITVTEPPLTGTHMIKLLGSGDSVLAEYPFTPGILTDNAPEEDELGIFGEVIPWITGTMRIEVYTGTLELASQSVSVNSPSVTLISPNGGEAFNETMPVSWEASDDDGDPLTYVIQYSADHGSTWQAITFNITGTTSYTITAGFLPGTDEGKIRVIASDGVNTGMDETDGTFTLAKKPPQAQIISPSNSAYYMPGQTIILEGSGYDVEDGTLPGSALSWRSDRDGELGTGKMLDATILTPGRHTITLTVTDQTGDTAIAMVDIFIGYQNYLPLLTVKAE